MTEVECLHRLLARRCASTEAYGEVSTGDERFDGGSGFLHVTLHLIDAEVMIFIEPSGDAAKAALSFLLPKGRDGVSLHLNGWRRPEGDIPVPALVDHLWSTFWAHEGENRGLGRTLWMHGPTLPPIEEDVPVQERLPLVTPVAPEAEPEPDPLDELLASVAAPATPPPKSRRAKEPIVSEEDVLALFGSD